MTLFGATAAATTEAGAGDWIGTWSAAQASAAPGGLSRSGFGDQVIRNVIHASAGGSAVRVRLSNVFGGRPLTVDAVQVALRARGAATARGTTRTVTFGGGRAVTIPPGERAWSDPAGLHVPDGADLAVSLSVTGPAGPVTWHPDACETTYFTEPRTRRTPGTRGRAFTRAVPHWFFLDGVDVLNPSLAGTVVAFGPSTTNGAGSTPGANARYPDVLARRLLALPPGERMTVLNAGISGNKLLADQGTCGPSAPHRFARDAMGQSGVRAVIVWEGTNDVATRPDLPLAEVTGAYQRLIEAAHAGGARIIGATLQPHEGAGFYSPAGNRLREAVNDWIRWSGAFDAVADFDRVLQDPRHPGRLRPAYDSGDHLHPNDAGYRAIAESVDLTVLTGTRPGRQVA